MAKNEIGNEIGIDMGVRGALPIIYLCGGYNFRYSYLADEKCHILYDAEFDDSKPDVIIVSGKRYVYKLVSTFPGVLAGTKEYDKLFKKYEESEIKTYTKGFFRWKKTYYYVGDYLYPDYVELKGGVSTRITFPKDKVIIMDVKRG